MFVRFVEYKENWNDKTVIKINRWYPSSKTCNVCGYINQDLNLSDREWICKNGHKLDRDLNASQNILKEGLKIYRQELAITKVERKSDVSDNAHSVKPEAHPIASGVGG
jgi:putative transposase